MEKKATTLIRYKFATVLVGHFIRSRMVDDAKCVKCRPIYPYVCS